jgi:hypothetical protein
LKHGHDNVGDHLSAAIHALMSVQYMYVYLKGVSLLCNGIYFHLRFFFLKVSSM